MPSEKFKQFQVEAMAEANAQLNNVALPTYTDLATAAANYIVNTNSDNWSKLKAIVERIPGIGGN